MNKHYALPNSGGSTISTRLTVKLIEELRRGRYADATRLPCEVDLARELGVSRSVVRDILSNLEREGMVERGRGVGTVINREVVQLSCRLDMKYEYNQLIVESGAHPATDHVKVYEGVADAHKAQLLGVPEQTPLAICEKRVLADGRPVIYSLDYLPQSLFVGQNWRAFDWSAPVFDLLAAHCGFVVDTSICRLRAELGPQEIRGLLEVQPGDVLIVLEEVGCYKMNHPVLYSQGYYTDYFGFTLLRKNF